MPAGSIGSIGMLFALSLVWGSTWIANDMLREEGGPLRLAILRYLLAGLLVACALFGQLISRRLRQGGQTGISHPDSPSEQSFQPRLTGPVKRNLLSLRAHSWITVSLLLGCTMFAAPDLLLVWSAGHVAASWIPMIYAGLPLGLLLVEGELRTPAILGVGAMLVLLNGALSITASTLLWTLPIAGAVSLQGWSLCYVRRDWAVASSLQGMMVQLFTAGLLLWIATRIWPEAPLGQPFLHLPASSLGALFLLASPATAVAYPLFYRLLQNLEPAQLAVSEWLQTLVAIGESAVLLRQRPGWSMMAAAAVLICCAAFLLRGSNEEVGPVFRLSS